MAGCYLLLVLALASCIQQGLPTRTADYIDPDDMLNFDSSSGTMKNKPKPPPETVTNVPQTASSCPPCVCMPCPACPTDSPASQPSVCDQAAIPLLRQYIRTLLRHMDGQLPMEKSEDYRMHVRLSANQVQMLQQFAEAASPGHVHDVHEILAGMVHGIAASSKLGVVEQFAVTLEQKMGMSLDRLVQFFLLAALASIVLLIEVKVRISWRRRITQLIVLMFVISVPWTWYELYRKAEIKQQSMADSDIPSDCSNRDGDMWSSLKSYFTLQEDKCLQYYEHIMIDPLVKVPPTKAIAITFVRFFIAPMKDVGGAVSEFIRALLIDLPITLYPVALGMVGFFVFMFMIMWFGYSIRLPFYLLSFERAPYQPAVAGGQVEQAIEDGGQQIRRQIETLQSMLESTEAQITDKLMVLDRRQQAALECSMAVNDIGPSPTLSRTSSNVEDHPSTTSTEATPSVTRVSTSATEANTATRTSTAASNVTTSPTVQTVPPSPPVSVSVTGASDTQASSWISATENRSEPNDSVAQTKTEPQMSVDGRDGGDVKAGP